jgi:membrane protein implicated in regulation of membrane protease activity
MVIFGVLEAITVGLTSLWFVVGGVGGLVVSMLGGPIWLQLVVFFVVSVGCMIAARPLVTKYINQKTVATNADRVLGGTARVTEAIDNTVPVGAVYVDGKTWSARSETDEPIAAGTMVRIKRMEGVRLFVEELKEDV